MKIDNKNIAIKPEKGTPKWDWIIRVNIPFSIKGFEICLPKVEKGFFKRILKKFKVKL